MKKQAALQIVVPKPCSQAWNEMRADRIGRHCAQCKKTVIDFTKMTDAQLLDYFRKNTAASCGRFASGQLDRVIRPVEVPKSPAWTRIAAGLLLALGLSKEASAQSMNRKEVTEQQVSDNKREFAPVDSTGTSEIYGTLVDEKGQPIVNANVTLMQGAIVITHDQTDFDGSYSVKVPGAGPYEVRFTYLGHMLTLNGVIMSAGNAKRKVCAKLSTGVKSVTVGMISIYRPPIVDAEYPGGHIIHSSDMLPHGW